MAYVAKQLTEGGDVTLTDPEGGQMTPEDVREGISKGVSDRVELRAATGPKHSKPEPIHTLRTKDQPFGSKRLVRICFLGLSR